MNDLYYKNGKAKKKYCLCLSREKIAELYRLHGRTIIQCAGNSCPYYSRDCGRYNIKRFETNIMTWSTLNANEGFFSLIFNDSVVGAVIETAKYYSKSDKKPNAFFEFEIWIDNTKKTGDLKATTLDEAKKEFPNLFIEYLDERILSKQREITYFKRLKELINEAE